MLRTAQELPGKMGSENANDKESYNRSENPKLDHPSPNQARKFCIFVMTFILHHEHLKCQLAFARSPVQGGYIVRLSRTTRTESLRCLFSTTLATIENAQLETRKHRLKSQSEQHDPGIHDAHRAYGTFQIAGRVAGSRTG